jgi:hypothetical protein
MVVQYECVVATVRITVPEHVRCPHRRPALEGGQERK